MANLRDIRNRISSIENTQQITKAMKMVAAAKLRKAQQRMLATRPYANKIQSVVGRLVDGSGSDNVLLRQPESTERVLMIVIGSDRGLCGAFNNNLFKVVEEKIRTKYAEFHEEGNLDIITVGRKADAYFKKRKYNVTGSNVGFFDKLNYESTAEIMENAIAWFSDGSYDKVVLAYNEFKSVIAQNRLVDEVLPIQPDKIAGDNEEPDSGNGDYLFEPDTETILRDILPAHLNMQLWRAVLESNASEQGARMAAMDNATENAKELERELRLEYNQARQSAITTEISEIVSGAAALEDA
ncbi:ATP synthase F1 subunit gamma [Rhodohalobacter mucosus]|uniref:ATP synthase gamma chain n=1 Tax=Rhodohalobacter mucosus TaxID=2079485 RepID=A0A316TV55_9BACT|nr:ATP synthase F1 subunit gamma [Rhodohalobacter mucosus]PWN06254.1 ATP synthase F1 subunit gamma [Rhodohalobacter mucosus]